MYEVNTQQQSSEYYTVYYKYINQRILHNSLSQYKYINIYKHNKLPNFHYDFHFYIFVHHSHGNPTYIPNPNQQCNCTQTSFLPLNDNLTSLRTSYTHLSPQNSHIRKTLNMIMMMDLLKSRIILRIMLMWKSTLLAKTLPATMTKTMAIKIKMID